MTYSILYVVYIALNVVCLDINIEGQKDILYQ